MDGDGLILYLAFCALCFGLGVLFATMFVEFENKKPPITKEDIKEELRQEIRLMTVPDFIEWIRR